MGWTGTQIANGAVPNMLSYVSGSLHTLQQGTVFDPMTGVLYFDILTGSARIPDITYNQAADVTLIPASFVPPSARIYLTDVESFLRGATAWTTGVAVELKDTVGAALASAPLQFLGGPLIGNTPVQGQQATAASFNATTGVITFASSTFITTTLAGVAFRVIGGTGAYQVSGIIASNTATTITPVGGKAGLNGITLDNTSVIEVLGHSVSAATGTTITCSKASFPITTSDLRGYYVQVLSGTGVGQVALISSNTATVLTVPTMLVTLDSTSVIQIVPSLLPKQSRFALIANGQGLAPVSTLDAGLVAHVNGSMGAGSPLRLRVRGFIAP